MYYENSQAVDLSDAPTLVFADAQSWGPITKDLNTAYDLADNFIAELNSHTYDAAAENERARVASRIGFLTEIILSRIGPSPMTEPFPAPTGTAIENSGVVGRVDNGDTHNPAPSMFIIPETGLPGDIESLDRNRSLKEGEPVVVESKSRIGRRKICKYLGGIGCVLSGLTAKLKVKHARSPYIDAILTELYASEQNTEQLPVLAD